ncbi:MAG: ribose 5-phosphate isomerase B [Candidatus Paceibacteria bacterium]|jgi:ribose 5-phosphate isomerase B
MKIYLAADHAGFELKESVKKYLEEKGHDVTDFGAHKYNEGDDYPDFIKPAAEAVAGDLASLGIIFGGSGQGEDMVADKIFGIRSAVYYGGNLEIVKLAREHNNANIISIGARFMDYNEATEAIDLFLDTKFSGDERHIRRIEKID